MMTLHPTEQEKLDEYFTKHATALAAYEQADENKRPNGLQKLKKAEANGVESQLYIGELRVASTTPLREIIQHVMALPSPIYYYNTPPAEPTAPTESTTQETDSTPKKPPLWLADNDMTVQEHWPIAVRMGQIFYNQAQEYARAGNIDEAIDYYYEAADRFKKCAHEHGDYLKYMEFTTYYQLNKYVRKFIVDFLQQPEGTHTPEEISKFLNDYEPILAHAGACYHALEHRNADGTAIPVEQRMAGLLAHQQGHQAVTNNLQDCHLLVVAGAAVSYLIHNDSTSSPNCDGLFAYLPPTPTATPYRAIAVGGNVMNSKNSVLNILNMLHAMAASGEHIVLEKAHLLEKFGHKVTHAKYNPLNFAITDKATFHAHPDQLMRAGWHLTQSLNQTFQPIIFDTRYHAPRQQLVQEFGYEKDERDFRDLVAQEQHFALPLDEIALYKLRYLSSKNFLKEKIEHSENNHVHIGHWYDEYDALYRAVGETEPLLLQSIMNDDIFLEKLQKKMGLSSIESAKTNVGCMAHEFPLYVGEGAAKANDFLAAHLKEVMLGDQDFSVFNYEFLTLLQYDLLAGKTHPYQQASPHKKTPTPTPTKKKQLAFV
ncbi:MAG: hypothetical protein ACOYK8_06690 [Alphaproteobacteria bacterium]